MLKWYGVLLVLAITGWACTTTVVQQDAKEAGPDVRPDLDIAEYGKDSDHEDAQAVNEGMQPCKTKEDCDLWFCVESGQGTKVCAVPCDEGACPKGFVCRTVVNPQNDLLRLCLIPSMETCAPCLIDADCQPKGAVTRDRCIELEPGKGLFCAIDCNDISCPTPFVCQQMDDKVRRCLPQAGNDCICPEFAVEAEMSTRCYVTNLYGTCMGNRVCTDSGLTACSAPAPAREVCGNGTDDDCDGLTDEEDCQGCQVYYYDGDGDGIGVQGKARCLSGPEGAYTAKYYGDCNDSSYAVSPGRTEVCNGIDDDCDGLTDEEGATLCKTFYPDRDGDGHGAMSNGRCLCSPEGIYNTTTNDDCNDSDPAIGPEAEEKCDGIDNDCDGYTDEAGAANCIVRYYDADGDGYGTTWTKCVCPFDPKYRADVSGDCDDSDPNVNPGADEICGNGKDDDCDGATDEGLPGCKDCIPYYWDLDWDGYGVTTKWQCLKEGVSPYTATKPGDCADGDPAVNPGKPEKCNGIDDNCNGLTDEEGAIGCKVYFLDSDHDGVGVTGSTKCLCKPEGAYTATTGGDCDDSDPLRAVGFEETCNGFDDDCDGQVDEPDAKGCVKYYFDEDGDGYGIEDIVQCLCTSVGNFRALKPGDCNDSNPLAFPGAQEVCNGIDDDCDGATDEEGASGCTMFWYDADNDGWGVKGNSKCLCKAQGKYRALFEGDCDDNDATRNQGREEICNNIDDDCDGEVDEDGACFIRIGIDPSKGGGESCGCACEGDINLEIALALVDLLDKDTANTSQGGAWKVTLSRTSKDENPSALERVEKFSAAKVERIIVIGAASGSGGCGEGGGQGTAILVAPFAGQSTMDLASRVRNAVIDTIGGKDRGIIRSASDTVVVEALSPTVRVEWGSVNDPTETTKASSVKDALARSLLHAIQSHFGIKPFDP